MSSYHKSQTNHQLMRPCNHGNKGACILFLWQPPGSVRFPPQLQAMPRSLLWLESEKYFGQEENLKKYCMKTFGCNEMQECVPEDMVLHCMFESDINLHDLSCAVIWFVVWKTVCRIKEQPVIHGDVLGQQALQWILEGRKDHSLLDLRPWFRYFNGELGLELWLDLQCHGIQRYSSALTHPVLPDRGLALYKVKEHLGVF